MSSRSLAAARSRRAGENAPPVSGNRPVTSIGSSAAFSQQMQPPSNVRLPRPQQQQNAYPPSQQNGYPPSQAYKQVQQSQQQSQNGLPFTKLSVSDAIGLITMRLGRCEQWIIETDHETSENDGASMTGLPENSRIIDNSILTNFVSRLDSLEKREPGSSDSIDNDAIGKLVEDVTKMNEHLAKIVEESSKHSIVTSKHTEQLYKFERELVETKDILKTFMLKYDLFTGETTEKLGDFEYAISEMEKNFPVVEEVIDYENTQENTQENDESETTILTSDLKSIINKELAAENM